MQSASYKLELNWIALSLFHMDKLHLSCHIINSSDDVAIYKNMMKGVDDFILTK